MVVQTPGRLAGCEGSAAGLATPRCQAEPPQPSLVSVLPGKCSCVGFGELHRRAPCKALELAQPPSPHCSGCWSGFCWDLVCREGFSGKSGGLSPVPPGKRLHKHCHLPSAPGRDPAWIPPPGREELKWGRTCLFGVRGGRAEPDREHNREAGAHVFSPLHSGGRRVPNPGRSGRSREAPRGESAGLGAPIGL